MAFPSFANQLEFRTRTSLNGGLAAVTGSGSPLAALGVSTVPRWLRLTRVTDQLAGPWSDIARSTKGAAVGVLQAGVEASESGSGAARQALVRDPASAVPRRFMRVKVAGP